MDREFKSLSFTNIKAQSSGRTRAGVCAVFGNVDDWGDRIVPGAFAKTISEGATRARHLWNHSYQHPPIASIKELKELSRDELPTEVIAKAPNAQGGLLVKREYYDTELSNWVLKAIDAGDINEMSFAYDVVRSATVTEPIDGDPEKTREIRELVELKLYDTSDVLWGMNFATVAAGAKGLALPLGSLASQLVLLKEEMKAGRRNSDSDQKLISLIHETAVSLGAVCNPGDEESDTGKSKAGAGDSETTPLSPEWFKFAEFELANLENH
jgi:HK97 family phage prohead protease